MNVVFVVGYLCVRVYEVDIRAVFFMAFFFAAQLSAASLSRNILLIHKPVYFFYHFRVIL